jgi:hypothetical protein
VEKLFELPSYTHYNIFKYFDIPKLFVSFHVLKSSTYINNECNNKMVWTKRSFVYFGGISLKLKKKTTRLQNEKEIK